MFNGIVAAVLIGASCLNIAGSGVGAVRERNVAFDEAEFTSIEFTSRTGNKTILSVRGEDLVMESDCARDVSIKVREYGSYKQVASTSSDNGYVTMELADKLREGRLYYIPMYYVADNVEYAAGNRIPLYAFGFIY